MIGSTTSRYQPIGGLEIGYFPSSPLIVKMGEGNTGINFHTSFNEVVGKITKYFLRVANV